MIDNEKGINVLSLFDGMSCGQIALERAGIKVDNYFASEIDKYAIQITQKNYPNTIQLGDVTKWKEWNIDWGSIGLIIGGSPCFKAGTKVITNNGYKNIEDISIGDMVLTHKNRFQKVVRIGGSIKTIYELKAQGILPLYTTHNHPFYVKTMDKIWSNKNRRYERVFSEAKWKEANNLQKNDFLGIPINNICDNKENITEDEAFILGRYIADGHTKKDYRISENRPNHRQWQLILSIGKNKIDDFNSKCKIKHSCYSHTQSTYRCVFSNKRLVELAENHCGVGAINKYISQTLLNLPTNILNELINGYISGDGSIKDDVYKASTISRELAMSLCLAVAKVYKVNTNIIFTKRPNKCIIEGRVVNQNDIYTIEFRKEWKKQSNAKLINDIIWLPLKSVICLDKKEQVYNLEVEEDNSYTANNCIVHNCQSFSIAGKGEGFEGKSGLFYTFSDILHHIKTYNPNIKFLLENVVMKKEWENVISRVLGINPILIDSALVSAQERPRLYWTNIENITQPNDKGLVLKDILEQEVDDKFFYKVDYIYHGDKSVCATLNIKGYDLIKRVHSPNFKCHTLTTCSGGNTQKKVLIDSSVRKLTPIEYERLQTVPDNYTYGVSNTARYTMLGNGWTVDVIAHIFSFLKKNIL
jgi:DNA (cytosine-5)-methyltransferase 3A